MAAAARQDAAIDLVKGRIISDEELKSEITASHPYETVAEARADQGCRPAVADEIGGGGQVERSYFSIYQQAFGYTQESIKFLMAPMAEKGEEAVGSMGNDTPISALS